MIRIFICILLMLPVIRPEGLNYIAPEFYNYFYTYIGSAVICAVAFGYAIHVFCKRNISKFTLLLVLYVFYSLVNTMFHDGPVLSTINCWARPLAVLFIFEMFKLNINASMRALQTVLIILVSLNLIYLIHYPEGVYTIISTGYTDCWFLGFKSSFQYYIFPLVVITTLYWKYQKECLVFLLVMLMAHVEAILSWNAMLIVGLVIYDTVLLARLYNWTKLFTIGKYSIYVIATNVLFIFFASLLLQWTAFRNLIYYTLNKSVTFATRMNLWSKGVEFIQQHWIFGYGYTTGDEMQALFGIPQIHLHNQFLMIILQGGFIGLLIFGLLMVVIIKKVQSVEALDSSKVLSLGLFIVFIMVLVEVFISASAMAIWPIFYLAYESKAVHEGLATAKVKTKEIYKKIKVRV